MMLVEKLREMYLESGEIEHSLYGSGVIILKDFLENWNNVLEFNRRYYANGEPKTVICGINPGRLGAGKTGIPFIDFKSLSKLIPNIMREDTERSAQFFYMIVEYFGAENFYRSFYVTNVSWLGYSKEGKNINFDDLPDEANKIVMSLFAYEMNIVKPTTVICLGRSVLDAVQDTVFCIPVQTIKYLHHPSYCLTEKGQYIEVLKPYIKDVLLPSS